MRITIICLLFAASIASYGQTGYDLKFTITGLQDTTVLLGHYYGESTYAKDTAFSKGGVFSFQGKSALPHGVYFLILGKTRLFDFVIGSGQNFKMETKKGDYVKTMKVTGDIDNKLFFDNMRFNADRNGEVEPIVKVLQDSSTSQDKRKEAREAFDKINKKVLAYQDDIIQKHPNTMTARLMKTAKRLEVPDAPKKPDGSIDSTHQLRYYRQHYFDYFDLSDDALMRLPKPIYTEKINEYLDKLYPPQSDSLIKAIDKLVAKARKNPETYKYAVYNCLVKYQAPEIMGLDAIFVHIYDKYFATGEMDFWANARMKQNIKEHADRLRTSLIGMQGKNLIMQDANLQPRSMYDIKNKYTILFIFDPDCSHCKEETPKLLKFYNEYRTKFDIEVFAVSSDTSMAKMNSFIKNFKMPWITVNGPRTYVGSYHDLYDAMQTPTLYILDEKKKIIAKKPPIESLPDFFANYERIEKKKAKSGSKSTP